MNLQNIIENRYVQATGALFAIAFVFWFVTGSSTSSEVATTVDATSETNETQQVSTKVNNDIMEVVVEAEKPVTSNNTDNDSTGEE